MPLYQVALNEAEADGEPRLAAEAAHMMGVAYKVENDYDNAIQAFEDAVARYRRLDRPYDIGRVERDIGITEDNAGKHNAALRSLESSVRRLATCPDKSELGISEVKLARHYLRTGQPERARPWLERGLAHIRQSGNWFYETTALWRLAAWHLHQGEAELARKTLEEALAILLKNDLGHEHGRRLAQIHSGLERCDEKLGNDAGAQTHHRAAKALLDVMSPEARALAEAEVREGLS